MFKSTDIFWRWQPLIVWLAKEKNESVCNQAKSKQKLIWPGKFNLFLKLISILAAYYLDIFHTFKIT